MDYNKLLNKKSIFIGFIFTSPGLSKGEDLHLALLDEIGILKKNYKDFISSLPSSYIGNTLAPSAVKQ